MGRKRWPRVLRRLQDSAQKWPGWQTALGNPRPKLLLGMKLEHDCLHQGVSLPLLFSVASGLNARSQVAVRFFRAQTTAWSSAKTSKRPHHTLTFPRYKNKGRVSTSDLCPDPELKKAHLPALPPGGLERSTLMNPGLTCRLQHTP